MKKPIFNLRSKYSKAANAYSIIEISSQNYLVLLIGTVNKFTAFFRKVVQGYRKTTFSS